MLDDLKFIANRDKSDALGVAEKQPQQLMYQFGVEASFDVEIQNIVVGAMGGSALGATMLLNWPQPSVPLVIDRQYRLPDFASANTLFIACSYSGETEEVIASLDQAIERGCQIVVVSDGGTLEQIAKERQLNFVKVPAGLQPRLAVWYMFRASLEILEAYGLADGVVDELETAVEHLESAANAWRPDVPVSQNYAKQLAEKVAGSTPVIYSGAALSSAAYKWKIDFNENAKNVAFWNVLPEVNHNEMQGWVSHPVDKPFKPIELRSDLYSADIQSRFDTMNRLLSGRMPAPIEINLEGQTVLEQMLWGILLGDFVSIYLGIINNVDPSSIELIEKFKTEL